MANRVWKDGTRRGIAYIEGREMAERVMTMTGRRRSSEPAPTAAVLPRRRSVRNSMRISVDAEIEAAAAAAAQREDAALQGAMAVYTDRRGKPFAWQIPFDIGHWEAVSTAVLESGGEVRSSA